MSLLPAAEWSAVGNGFYRKFEIYSLKWKLSIGDLFLSSAPYGGPIAVSNFKDPSASKNFQIRLFTGAGQPICQIQWKSGDLSTLGWSLNEDLLCVQTDGKVLVYSMFGQLQDNRMFTFGTEVQQTKVLSCQIFSTKDNTTGIAVLTTSYRFYIVGNVMEPKSASRFSDVTGRNTNPSCWTVLCDSRISKIVVVYGAEIYLLSLGEQPVQLILPGGSKQYQYAGIAVSPDSSKLALVTVNGIVQICSTDMREAFCEVDSGLRRPPEKFLWCGNSGVSLYLDENISLIDYKGDSTCFTFDEPVHIGAEKDGLRILSSKAHEFLSPVPEVLADVFSVGSVSPGALLLEAFKEFQNQSYKSNEYMQMDELKHGAELAVNQCAQAAVHEFDLPRQQLLLKAASYGKAFAGGMDSDAFVHQCRTLRVLNCIRDFHFGIAITYDQLAELTIPVLLDRLISRRQWPLAMAVCNHMRIPVEQGVHRILGHWALMKISQRTLSDEEIATAIKRKFDESPGISYADVAKEAALMERKTLATQLLENEPQMAKQVHLLMKFGHNEKALAKALDTGDVHLVYLVILKLKENLSSKDQLDMTLRKSKVTYGIYKQFCRLHWPNHLRELFLKEDDFDALGLEYLKDAAARSVFDVKEKKDDLSHAAKYFSQGRDEFSAKTVEDQVKLLSQQEDLEDKLHSGFVDGTLRDTIIWLIEHGENSKADGLRKEFKVTDKQYCWWKVESLARSAQWSELEATVKGKKSLIGFVPYVELCMKYNNLAEARKYLSKVPLEDKVKCLIKMKLLNEAAQSAFEQKDMRGLNMVLAHCGPQPENRGLSEQIANMKAQLEANKK